MIPEVRACTTTIGCYRTIGQIARTPGPWAIGTHSGPTAATRPGHPHGVHQPHQLAGISVLTRGQAGGQVAAAAVADGVQLGGQPTP
jgi:hypothetical protein